MKVHRLRGEDVVDKRYDLVFLPGVRRPMVRELKSDETRRVVRRVVSIAG